MSQIQVGYGSGQTPKTIQAFSNRACSLPANHADYAAPTPDELGALIAIMGWSQSDVAKLTGVSYNVKKGSPTVRRWKAPADKPDHRDIPYSAWRLLLLYAGVVAIDEGLRAIDDRQLAD